MLEDKESGIKVAENSEEAFWNIIKKKCEDAIKNCEHEIIIQKHILRLCSDRLKPFSKA